MIPEPKIQNDLHRRFSSSAKYLLLHLNNYRFSKSNPDKDGPYIHREHLENRLESWLLNSSKSGSYLVSGYRGMGKSSLVDKVIERVTKVPNHDLERIWNVAIVVVFVLAAAYIGTREIVWLIGGTSFILVALLISFINRLNVIKNEIGISIFPNGHIFSREKIKKILAHYDKSQQSHKRISIRINLGKEVVNAKDVMCLIATHIRDGYQDYLKARHNRPLQKCIMTFIVIGGAILITRLLLIPLADYIIYSPNIRTFICRLNDNQPIGSIPTTDIEQITVLLFCFATWLVRWFIRTIATSFDKSRVCLARLNYLSDWITSEISEEQSYNVNTSGKIKNNPLSLGMKRSRGRKTHVITVRDIEAELIDIINTINSSACLEHNRVQFIIVLDELDKIEQQEEIRDNADADILTPPEFTTTVNGFSNNATNNERKNVVLHILGNMKLFLTTAKAKFIFISGREMFDAYLADTSDREYAISSIFSGVINVNSFLYPDREQSDVGSLTEQYLAEILIPEDYLWHQTLNNAIDNKILKREAASLRWYTQYLTELVDQENLDSEERRQRIMEIRHIVTFLHDFIAYLSHVSKGAPKKIVLHLDEYVRRRQDCVKLYDWDDHMEYGKSYYSENRYNTKKHKGVQQDYVLYFTPQDQQKIGFISYLTAPLKNVLINSVSNYNDKLLIEASFLIDHLFKFHGRGFSWRNIEQTPELLDVSKTSDLGDFIASIMEFMQQQHLSPIMVGLYKYKFRKRISEEIAYISRISDEAAALFNFTLNESKPTRQYNIKLLNYYMKLNAQVGTCENKKVYYDVMSRIHATLADLYFLEENYARALQEYRNSISLLDQLKDSKGQESSTTTITRLRNTLKMALTCEYSKNYETAYAIYCNLVDKMISVREVDERKLGLDLVNTWTNDWRIKQPMIVDPNIHKIDCCEKILNEINPNNRLNTYKHEVYDLMWKDGRQYEKYENSEYSLNFENLVSGFSKNLSPEKSHFIAKLSLFEDVRLVYKAILAKLFIIEKMNMSGITLSNIETAEAEFKYLHRTTNLKEKFFVSADFFNELGKILYYKNNLTLISANKNIDKQKLYKTLNNSLNQTLKKILNDTLNNEFKYQLVNKLSEVFKDAFNKVSQQEPAKKKELFNNTFAMRLKNSLNTAFNILLYEHSDRTFKDLLSDVLELAYNEALKNIPNPKLKEDFDNAYRKTLKDIYDTILNKIQAETLDEIFKVNLDKKLDDILDKIKLDTILENDDSCNNNQCQTLKNTLKSILRKASSEGFIKVSKEILSMKANIKPNERANEIFNGKCNEVFDTVFNDTLKRTSDEAIKKAFVETLRDALYWCDIDLYAYLDEFCFYAHNCNDSELKGLDSMDVKDVIRNYFDNYYICDSDWERDNLGNFLSRAIKSSE